MSGLGSESRSGGQEVVRGQEVRRGGQGVRNGGKEGTKGYKASRVSGWHLG